MIERRDRRGHFTKGDMPWNKRLDSTRSRIISTCKFCGEQKSIEELEVARRFCRLHEENKGKMIADRWRFVTPAPDMEDRIDARATLELLPKRMVKADIKRDCVQKLVIFQPT